MHTSSELIPRVTLDALVMCHDESQRLAKEALEQLGKAETLMKAHCAAYHQSVFPSGSYACRIPEAKEVALEVRRNHWRTALQIAGIKEMMSTADANAFEKQFRENTLPEFSKSNVLATLQGLARESGDIKAAAVQEAFRILRPRNTRHKTNRGTNVKVQGKVILSGWAGVRYVNHYCEDGYRAIDRAFHMLDGKRPPSYPNDIITTIHDAIRQGKTDVETPYFRLKWFKNGNLHMEFKRLDLVDDLNRIGAGGRNDLP